jgi:hypothetical protein
MKTIIHVNTLTRKRILLKYYYNMIVRDDSRVQEISYPTASVNFCWQNYPFKAFIYFLSMPTIDWNKYKAETIAIL